MRGFVGVSAGCGTWIVGLLVVLAVGSFLIMKWTGGLG